MKPGDKFGLDYQYKWEECRVSSVKDIWQLMDAVTLELKQIIGGIKVIGKQGYPLPWVSAKHIWEGEYYLFIIYSICYYRKFVVKLWCLVSFVVFLFLDHDFALNTCNANYNYRFSLLCRILAD